MIEVEGRSKQNLAATDYKKKCLNGLTYRYEKAKQSKSGGLIFIQHILNVWGKIIRLHIYS